MGPGRLAAADEMKHLWDSCMFPQVFFYTLGTAYLGDVLIREKIPAPGQEDTGGSFMTTNNRQQTQTAAVSALDEKTVIRKLSLCSILGNSVLSGFKLFAGIAGHSGAMNSDSIHSFSDVLTTFIAWFGVKISRKAPDQAHPYGHERLECVASLLLGAVLLLTGLGVGKSGMENILSGQYETLSTPGLIALVAAVVSIVGKEAMYWYTRYYAKLIHSSAFMADAWHHRSDAFSSIGSLIGIAVPGWDSRCWTRWPAWSSACLSSR